MGYKGRFGGEYTHSGFPKDPPGWPLWDSRLVWQWRKMWREWRSRRRGEAPEAPNAALDRALARRRERTREGPTWSAGAEQADRVAREREAEESRRQAERRAGQERRARLSPEQVEMQQARSRALTRMGILRRLDGGETRQELTGDGFSAEAVDEAIAYREKHPIKDA